MLLAVDVGNSNTVIGLFEKDHLICDWRIRTTPHITGDEFNITIANLFQIKGIPLSRIDRSVISCVVPPMMKILEDYCTRYLGHSPVWITAQSVQMPIVYDHPDEVGADRLVNGIAAYHMYRQSLIVIDFGTATTFDVISTAGEYLGGAIAPGIGIAAEALFKKAAKLPRVELRHPKTVIGKNTVHSMQSGIIFGYAEMVDGMVRRIQKEMPDASGPPKVIATGGLALLMQDISATIESVVPGLTLEGLKIISQQL